MNQQPSTFLNIDAALNDIQLLIEQSRQRVTSYVNTSLTLLYWHIGQRIEHELLINGRAAYGNQILATLSQELTLHLLVPKLQIGNSVPEASDSSVAKLELRRLGSQTGAWEPANGKQVLVGSSGQIGRYFDNFRALILGVLIVGANLFAPMPIEELGI